ncbi:nucleotide-binding protein [Stenotrophomonas sp. Br8]|uniref:TIR domain-containing protein n=1 Tax=Stenotrophomonas sp. Br8 TaxID=2759658 RepID=UPI00168BA1E4|nr:nucleotide-binding protein [Stenotrophomonas sp. Br8]MBD3682998.1 nucleotide-binding protein [Stenotrophomonas sp. Br8]
MERSVEYQGVKFSVDTIRSAINGFRQLVSELKEQVVDETLKVTLSDGQWAFDNETEFLSAVPQGGSYVLYMNSQSVRFRVNQLRSFALVEVKAPSRPHIQRIFSPFDMNQGAEVVPADSPVVFIGHGRSTEWRDLRDHLRDQHDYRIECYESGARAGHSIRDILESMIKKSSFALLVMTGEDMQESGEVRARQNVIHEAGLFQGRLGFARAIILLEEGVAQFSNVQGVQYIPFSKGRIREAYGDVLAALRREFGRN